MDLRRKLPLTVALAAAMVIGAASSSDAVLIYTLSSGNADLSPYSGPFGTVEVTLLSGTYATVKFIANAGPVGGYRYLFGDGGVADFNVGSAVTTSVVSYTAAPIPGGSTPSISGPTAGNVDGWGNFNMVFDDFDGYGHTVSDVTFGLTKSSGNWATEADILTPNANGYSVATHVFVVNADYTNTGATGYAAGQVIPEPTTILALGAGLMVLGVARKRTRAR